MADKKASTTEAKPRKKPVRKAPVQKDYPTKLAWLKAMTEYEEAQAKATTDARVARLEKRLATKQAQLDKLQLEVNVLINEINWLLGETVEVELPEPEAETPSA